VARGHKAFYIILILIATIIVVVQGGAYYYYQRSTSTCPSPCPASLVSVETLINYGNGTSQWINKTNVPSNWNFYQLTASISKVQATYYGPPTSEHYVTGINGVQSNPHYFWSLWVLCKRSNAWSVSTVGADEIYFTTFHTVAWYYQALTSQDQAKWYSPVAGAPKVSSC